MQFFGAYALGRSTEHRGCPEPILLPFLPALSPSPTQSLFACRYGPIPGSLLSDTVYWPLAPSPRTVPSSSTHPPLGPLLRGAPPLQPPGGPLRAAPHASWPSSTPPPPRCCPSPQSACTRAAPGAAVRGQQPAKPRGAGPAALHQVPQPQPAARPPPANTRARGQRIAATRAGGDVRGQLSSCCRDRNSGRGSSSGTSSSASATQPGRRCRLRAGGR